MKSKYEKLELKLTIFDENFDIVKTSLATGTFDEDWMVNPTNGEEDS